MHCYCHTLLSKTPGSDLTRKRVRGGQTQFGVRPIRNPGQTDLESESERHFGLRFRKFLPGFQINLTREYLECMAIAMHFGTFHFTPTPIFRCAAHPQIA